jgi:hypothetical protein
MAEIPGQLGVCNSVNAKAMRKKGGGVLKVLNSHHIPQSKMGDHGRIEPGKSVTCVYPDKKTDIMSGYIATDRGASGT